MDNFEKHIRENKSLFDDHKVDKEKLWTHISNDLNHKETKVKTLWKSPMVKIAAILLLLLGIATTIDVTVNHNRNIEKSTYASKELQEIDMHYKNLVSYQVKLVENLSGLSDDEKAEFLSFMDALDDEYDALRLEMKNNLNNELVLEAIVSSYKKRIELIENLLKRINNSKNQDDDGYIL